jgi:hypothetical protein
MSYMVRTTYLAFLSKSKLTRVLARTLLRMEVNRIQN